MDERELKSKRSSFKHQRGKRGHFLFFFLVAFSATDLILKNLQQKVITLWLLPLGTKDNYHHPSQQAALLSPKLVLLFVRI